jgi:hypothetical protein
MVFLSRFHPQKTPSPLAELSHAWGTRHQHNDTFPVSSDTTKD